MEKEKIVLCANCAGNKKPWINSMVEKKPEGIQSLHCAGCNVRMNIQSDKVYILTRKKNR